VFVYTLVIDTNCIGSCKYNYHTITATAATYIYQNVRVFYRPYRITRKRGEKFGLMLKIDSTGNLMIVKTDDSLVALLGNRYVELTFMKRKFNSGIYCS
jgi:hypothetical protein